jgi:uncharacterized protein YcsI (UPF0317 family)
MDELASPVEVRRAARDGRLRGPTCSLAPGYLQANLIILPRDLSEHFEKFCRLNPKPCPVLEILDDGPISKVVAKGSDIRTDLPGYLVWEEGRQCGGEVRDIRHLWPDDSTDFVAFLLGCSFGFEHALAVAGLMPRHNLCGVNVSMYNTNIPCESAGCGPFSAGGNLIVSMRPYTADQVEAVRSITHRYPKSHGSPIHCGSGLDIGIKDTGQPDYGDAVVVRDNEVPMFWACGVTPAAVCAQSKIGFFITHSPGKMLVCDILAEEEELDAVL